MSIYEMHVGSWKRVFEEGNRSLSYRELATTLPQYLQRMGFTHVEFLPVMDHPFFGSWGYQTTGYFASSGYYGTPQDLMFLIDELHRHDIGVILDWVPSHFPTDGHGLSFFDGTHLYEHADPRQGFQPDWETLVFNYGRNEVRSVLISSAIVLAGQVPCGRPARRRSRFDAVLGLFTKRGRMDSQSVRRERKSRGDRFSAAA